MAIRKIFIWLLLLLVLVGCKSNKESINNETSKQNAHEVVLDNQNSEPKILNFIGMKMMIILCTIQMII